MDKASVLTRFDFLAFIVTSIFLFLGAFSITSNKILAVGIGLLLFTWLVFKQRDTNIQGFLIAKEFANDIAMNMAKMAEKKKKGEKNDTGVLPKVQTEKGNEQRSASDA